MENDKVEYNVIEVLIDEDGNAVVYDFSHDVQNNQRKKLVEELSKMGIEIETVFDSMCG